MFVYVGSNLVLILSESGRYSLFKGVFSAYEHAEVRVWVKTRIPYCKKYEKLEIVKMQILEITRF